MSEDTVRIEIDGRELEAPRGANIIQVADREGIFIPRFCYHPKLSIAANCRMCLVEVERAPKPLPACATPVTDGMKVFTRSDRARDAQRAVMEFLLINHPLDCPICDQGGECELQDLALGYGRSISRFTERKRVVPDPDLGPLIATDMTRCIHCTRCIRFGEEIAGIKELGATGRGEHMRIGTYVQRAVTSELSGNVIDVCPVGALTAKPSRYRARAWEMIARPAVSPHDCVGSSLFVHVRSGELIRVVPRPNEDVNEAWCSDRDRFAYEGLRVGERLEAPFVRRDGVWEEVDWAGAVEAVASALRGVEPGRLAALVSPMATTEEHFLVQSLVRGLGSGDVDHRLFETDFRDQDTQPVFPGLELALPELERSDAVLVVGGNPRKEQPLLNLRLRKAALRGGWVGRIHAVAHPGNFPLGGELLAAPEEWVSTLAGVARALPPGEGEPPWVGAWLGRVRPRKAERELGERLARGSAPVVLLGTAARQHPDAALVRLLTRIVASRAGARFGELPVGGNAAGAALAGALPHRGAGAATASPVGVPWPDALAEGRDAYILFGIDPELDTAFGERALECLEGAGHVIAFTGHRSPALERVATVLLPIGLFSETDGTFVNASGLWQSTAAGSRPPGEARPGWRVLRVLGHELGLAGFDFVELGAVGERIRAACRESGIELDQPLPARSLPSEAPAVIPADEEAARALLLRPDEERTAAWRIPEVAPLAVDAIVRRSRPLQASADGARVAAHISPRLARRLGVEAGRARISLGGRSAEVELVLDERVADHSIAMPAGVPGLESFPALCAPVEEIRMIETVEAAPA